MNVLENLCIYLDFKSMVDNINGIFTFLTI